MAFLRGSSHDRLAALYSLILLTGLRRGEAVGLRWNDIDLDAEYLMIEEQITDVNGTSIVGPPKSSSGSDLVPLDSGTVFSLKAHHADQDLERLAWGQAWHDTGYVFTMENGKPLRPEYATRHFHVVRESAGVRRIRLHDLRHTNASIALAAGVEMKVVSERLGHSQMRNNRGPLHPRQPVAGQGRRQPHRGASDFRARTVPSAFLARTPKKGKGVHHAKTEARARSAGKHAGQRPKGGSVAAGAGEGTRTPNPLFTRQVRCQLRHAGRLAPHSVPNPGRSIRGTGPSHPDSGAQRRP